MVAPPPRDDPALVAAANGFIKPGKRSRAEIAASLVRRDDSMTAANLLGALRIYVKKAKGSARKDGPIINAIMETLSGDARHQVAIRVIADDVLGRGRLDSITRLEYYLVSPYILIEDVFCRPNGETVKSAARMFRKEAVMEVVKEVLRNFDKPEVVIAVMKEKEELAQMDFHKLAQKWKPVELRKFVERVCGAIGEPVPGAESRRLLHAIALRPIVDSFMQGQIEDIDAFPLLERLDALNGDSVESTVEYLSGRAPALASFVSERVGRGPIAQQKPFFTSCARPFNKKLHDLPCDDGLILKNESDVEVFKRRISKARFISLMFHAADKVEGDGERIGLVTFYMRGSAIFFLPYLFPALVKPVRRALRDYEKLTLVYRWQRWEKACKTLFKWVPTSLLDADAVAKEEGMPSGFDAMAEFVSHGHFCRRASNFGDLVMPSAAARKHQAIRAALVYEFLVKKKGLRESQGPCRENQGWPDGYRSVPGGERDREVWLEYDADVSIPKCSRV